MIRTIAVAISPSRTGRIRAWETNGNYRIAVVMRGTFILAVGSFS
jgi:hypothetical protein